MPRAALRPRFGPLTAAADAQLPAGDGERCVTCGRVAGTPFCPHCGERRAGDRPLHVRELFEEAWGEFASVDGRVLRSFWTLLRHPGALTVAYVKGERLRYLTPLKLFLVVNVAFFLFVTASGVNTLTTPLVVHMQGSWHASIATRLVEGRLAARHVPLAVYAPRFDAVATEHAKTLVIALVPLYAVCVALVQARRRRPLLEHVVFALHATSVVLLAQIATYYGIYYGARAVAWAIRHTAALPHAHLAFSLGDGDFTLVLGAVFCAWLAPALRRNYGGGWAGNVIRAVGLTACFVPVLFAYRAVLFVTTFWTT